MTSEEVRADMRKLTPLDVTYLLAVTSRPDLYRAWGERAQAAEVRGLELVGVVMGGQHPLPGWTCQRYNRALFDTWRAKTPRVVPS